MLDSSWTVDTYPVLHAVVGGGGGGGGRVGPVVLVVSRGEVGTHHPDWWWWWSVCQSLMVVSPLLSRLMSSAEIMKNITSGPGNDDTLQY